MIPDITFDGSSTPTPDKPEVTFTRAPASEPWCSVRRGRYANSCVNADRTTTLGNYTVQEFTEIVYTRLRGRQMAFKVELRSAWLCSGSWVRPESMCVLMAGDRF
jgi:hypothetical protein